MQYRTLGRTGMKVSEIGLGCEHLQGQDQKNVEAVISSALDHEINIMDVFMSEPQVRSNIGTALQGKRDRFMIQGHIGAAWLDGQYCRTRDMGHCQAFFEDLLTRLETDYIDIGMLHFVDTQEDFDGTFHTGLIEYALNLKEKGKIRALGMSSHNPVIAAKAVETGWIDVLMFSLNPAYDLLPEETDVDHLFMPETFRQQGLAGVNPARAALYELCAGKGTAITVMKGFGAGTLLRAESSPFDRALTPEQCCHYALTRPGVASILVGCRTPQEVARAVEYETATNEQRDFGAVLSQTPRSMKGACMYCNHCLPCPSHLDIAAISQYLDLALVSEKIPDTVKAHYMGLTGHGSDCIQCGQCEERCPFGVPVRDRMRQAAELFGK